AGAVERRDRLRHPRQLGMVDVEAELSSELTGKRLRFRREHERRTTGANRLCDLVEVLTRGSCAGDVRRLFLPEDRRVETLQQRARLDPELCNQELSAFAVHVERVGLTTGAIERDHQLAA